MSIEKRKIAIWVGIDLVILLTYYILSVILLVGAFNFGERDGSGLLVLVFLFPIWAVVNCISVFLILLQTLKPKIKHIIFMVMNIISFSPFLYFLLEYYSYSNERGEWVILMILFPIITTLLYKPTIRLINNRLSDKYRVSMNQPYRWSDFLKHLRESLGEYNKQE